MPRGCGYPGSDPDHEASPIQFPGISTELERLHDPEALEARWRALEARADSDVFRSWTWVGCLAAERFPNAVLLSLREGDAEVGLALCNCRGSVLEADRLFLGQSGRSDLDAIYVEHNGPLLAKERPELMAVALRALLEAPLDPRAMPGWWLRRAVVLAGVDDAVLAAARASGGVVRVLRSQPAPYVDLTLPGGFLEGLSANTRYQLRRSAKLYAAEGELAVHRAASVADGLAVLEELAMLHQAGWQARGQPGAFAGAFFRRFHSEFVARGLPRGEVDLLRVTAGERTIGCLYNIRAGGRVMSYQSGFDYAGAGEGSHRKPGLTCHDLAIAWYRAQGCTEYDFLAGEARYKTSLSHASRMLHWIELRPRLSPLGLAFRLTGLTGR